MKIEEYTKTNANVINSWVTSGWEWGIPIDHQQYLKALDGDWAMLLTPTNLE